MIFFRIFMPLLLCLAFLSASYPTDSRWEELDRRVDSLYRQEKYAEALTTAREAIRVAQITCCPDDYDKAHASLTKYGQLLQGQGKYAEAEAAFLSALGSTGGEEPNKDLEMKTFGDLRDLYAVWGKRPETVAYDALLQSSGDEVRAPDIVKARIAEAAKDNKSRQKLPVNVAALAVLYRHYEGTRSQQELEQFVTQAERSGADDLNLAECLEKVGEVFVRKGTEYRSKAASLFKKVLGLKERNLKPDDPEIARTLHNLAKAYDSSQSPEKEALLKRALDIRIGRFGKDSVVLADTLEELGHLYSEKGYYCLAACCFEKCGKIRETSFIADASLGIAASLYAGAERYGKAETLLEDQLSEMEGWDTKSAEEGFMGPGPQLLEVYEAQGKYEDAEALHKRWIALREALSGPGHPYTNDAVIALAEFYIRRERYAEAEKLLSESTPDPLRKERSEFPVSIGERILSDSAQIKMKQGKLDEAKVVLTQCRSGCSRQVNGKSLCCASELASLFEAQGKPAEAEAVYKVLLSAWEKDHPEWTPLDALDSLADFYLRHNRLSEAENAYIQAGQVIEKACGRECFRYGVWMHDFAKLYARAGMYDKAEDAYLQYLQRQTEMRGPDHGLTIECLKEVSELYGKTGQKEKAREFAERAQAQEQHIHDLERELGCEPDQSED